VFGAHPSTIDGALGSLRSLTKGVAEKWGAKVSILRISVAIEPRDVERDTRVGHI